MAPSVRPTWATTFAILASLHVVDCAQRCTDPFIRREWRSLSLDERDDYINATKCLMNKDPETSLDDLPGVQSRYEDFLGTHIVHADDVHFVGAFYPYHRLMMHVYEQEIQTCGWSGGIPYWDWSLDNDNDDSFINSPVFDTESGFGGNGDYIPGDFDNPPPGLLPQTPWDVPDRTGGGCIRDGPFVGMVTNLGPQQNIEHNPHCVRRDFAPQSFRNLTSDNAIDEGMGQPDYGFFDRVTESTFHSGGHWGPGGLFGTLTDKWASPADPIFYVHHANVDRAWWSWQIRDLEKRVRDISGPLVNFDWENEQGGNITLDHNLFIGETKRVEAKVRDVMHIQRGLLCYEYDSTY